MATGRARATQTTATLKQLFVDQVDQIVWKYKLAPETINLRASKAVAEIQVFGVALRDPGLDTDVLRTIDKAIPYPLIFELTHDGKRKAIAAYKRPSETDSTKWVVSDYFETEWEPEEKPRQPLPTALDLASLYERLLSALIPTEVGTREPLEVRVLRREAIRAQSRQVERIKSRLGREKQFNKRVAINAELRAATSELKKISRRLQPKDSD